MISAIALTGGLTIVFRPAVLDRLRLPFILLAAGTLLGGAFFYMIPEDAAALDPLDTAVWLVSGFTTFSGLEQFLHWYQTHKGATTIRKPVCAMQSYISAALHSGLGSASCRPVCLPGHEHDRDNRRPVHLYPLFFNRLGIDYFVFQHVNGEYVLGFVAATQYGNTGTQ